MKISVISFTKQGKELADKIESLLWEHEIKQYHKPEQKLTAWAAEQFQEKRAILFIGACGIAVRAIAPSVRDKLTDPPVVVTDDEGRFVIPILSGHIGGANEMARLLAGRLQATPVITTATDIHDKLAIDLFAKKNDLRILNRDGIAKVSAKILADRPLLFLIEDYEHRAGQGAGMLPEGVTVSSDLAAHKADVLIAADAEDVSWHDRAVLRLKPREYTVGIGCKKGKTEEEIKTFVFAKLQDIGLSASDIARIASIDAKKNEPGLCRFAESIGVPFVTYGKEQLRELQGSFCTSAFVEETVGVDNVCERAALKACMGEGELVLSKQAYNGMTMAAARRNWTIKWEW